MGVNPAVFQSGGQASQHYIPGAYSRLDFVKSAGGLSSINNAVIVGDSRGGKPNELLWFSSPSQAAAVLRDGPLLDAIKHAFKPAPDIVPQRIAAWRVNPGLQASSNFLVSSDAVITAKAWDYGLHTNQVKRKVESGTNSGKKITVAFMNETEFVADDVEKESFVIQYTGSAATAVMDIDATGITTTTAGDVNNLSVPFASFPTIQDVVNYINDQTDYTCTLAALVPSDPSSQLDYLSSQDIKTSAYTAKSDLQAFIDALVSCPWIDSVTYNVTASGRTVPDNAATWGYFTGGTDGAYTTSELTTSLTALEKEDIQFMGSSSADASFHALIKTHCVAMNSVTGKNERQFLLGGASDEAVSAVVTRAQNLNSDAGALVYPEFQDYDDDGDVVWWSPVYYAAKLIGLMTTLAINEPATNKQISVLSFKTVSTVDIETLIKAGVTVGRQNPTGQFVTVRMINTYQGNILQRNEFSMMREALYINRDLRNSVESTFVGRALTNGLLADIDATVNLKLSQYYELGLFNGDPPYSGYNKTVNGDQITIEFDCFLTPPTNFIFITSHMSVFASTNG